MWAPGSACRVFAPANPLLPFSSLCCGHRQQPHDLSPLMSLVRAQGESQRHLLALMGLKMSHCPRGLRVQCMLVEKKNVINTENMCPVALLLGFRHRRSTRSVEMLSLGTCSVLGREADGEAFLLKIPRGPCGPWPWPHHACSGGRAAQAHPPLPTHCLLSDAAERILTKPPSATPDFSGT